jgi:hypothetical protein
VADLGCHFRVLISTEVKPQYSIQRVCYQKSVTYEEVNKTSWMRRQAFIRIKGFKLKIITTVGKKCNELVTF